MARRGAPPTGDAGLGRRAAIRIAWLVAASGILALSAVASIAFGTRAVTATDFVAALTGHADGFAQAAIVARIPRTVLALLVGAALAVAGCAMQTVTRNPLAEPGIIGVTGGASLAVVAGIAFFGLANPYATMGVAVLGAASAAVFVYAVGSLGRGGATPLKLTLAGAATSAACVSLVSAITLPRADIIRSVQFWQVGGVGGATWERIGVIAPVLAAGFVVCVAVSRGMNALALGDDVASGLGAHVGRTRALAALGAIVLSGVATSVAGPIGFVGLIVPHACRALVGSDTRWLMPASALVGGTLLTVSDVVGRVVAAPESIDVGIITAIVGAPCFIWIVRRQKVRGL